MLGSLIAVLFGCVFVILGLWWWYSRRKFFKRAIMVSGIITGYKNYQDREGDGKETTMYHAIATFELDGEKREVVSLWSTSVKPKIGKPCQVGINPDDMNEARIYSKMEGFFNWILIGFGLLAIVLGIGSLTGKF